MCYFKLFNFFGDFDLISTEINLWLVTPFLFSSNTIIEEILVGLCLGDGWLEVKKKNARFRFEQSQLHEDYFFYVFKYFALFGISSAKLRVRVDPRSNKTSYTWHFSTRSLPLFTHYYNLFYYNKVKIIPSNIKDLLTPIGLAFWIMDDGNSLNKGLVLNTQSFNEKEVEFLVYVLKSKFNLDCWIRKEKNLPVIYIPRASMAHLRTLVLPYMHNSMLYKLGISDS